MGYSSYISTTYRRKLHSALQEKYKHHYKGIVLDIGGRDRGSFKKPKDKVEQWIFADIEQVHQPDIVMDVADMHPFADNSVDVIAAMELFEHVERIELGLLECYRVLKPGGVFLVSIPFLFPIHADPFDFQRWTAFKWQAEVQKLGFSVEAFEVMGRFFTVAADMYRIFVRTLPWGLKHLGYLSFPLWDLFTRLDNTSWVKNQPRLKNYQGGYFMVLRK